MANYHLPPDDDPVAQWVAYLNYLGQLCDERAEYEGLFEPSSESRQPSAELHLIMAEWRALAAIPAFPVKQLPLL